MRDLNNRTSMKKNLNPLVGKWRVREGGVASLNTGDSRDCGQTLHCLTPTPSHEQILDLPWFFLAPGASQTVVLVCSVLDAFCSTHCLFLFAEGLLLYFQGPIGQCIRSALRTPKTTGIYSVCT